MRFSIFLILILSVSAQGALSGFEKNIAAAQAHARQQKKPLLYDFGAIWCPPCNELKETVFSMPAFLQKAKSFELIEVDVDAKESWGVKDRYKVGAYPTVVFADYRGKEIYRIVGYRTLKEFLRMMDLVLASKDTDFTKACRSRKTDDLWRCATVCAERHDQACAQAAFHKLEKKLPPGSPQYQDARTYFVEQAPNFDLKRDGYERLLAELPESPRAILWAADYLELLKSDNAKGVAPKREVLEKVLVDYGKSLNDPAREVMGIESSDMAEARAMVLDKLGRADEAKAAWKEAAGLLDKAATALPAGTPARGFNIERIGCLESAGDLDGALKLAEEYRAKYPQEFTFHFWTASLFYRAKRYNEALPVARKAYEVSYGDNRIRAATLLVNLYATIPDRGAAKQVHDEVTHDIQPGKKLEVRTHRYLKALDESMARVPGASKS